MKKTVQKLLLALLVAMLCVNVKAQTSGTCGYPNADDVTWSYDSGTLTFTGTGAMNMYEEDHPDAPWWNYYATTTKVVVGEGITTIPHWAFAMFEHLTSVSLPSTLTTIGKAAFEECAFTTINLPEGLETIGDYAFQMTPLTSVTIPSTVTGIGEVAFQANDALIYVNCLATTPPTMGENVFQACTILSSIYVPAAKVDTYKDASGWSTYQDLINSYIGGSCGANATWQYRADLNTMTISGTGAMSDYSSSDMTQAPWNTYRTSINQVIIGDEITHVGNWAFQGCTDLRSVVIGENVTSIGNGSFDNCTNDGFTVLTIPNSVQTIGIDAFSNNHLKYVCFGSGLTEIGMEAFMVCQNLEAIGVYASTPPTFGTDAFVGCSALATIYVPSAKIGDYKAASGWSDYAAMVKSPTGECGTNATWSFEMTTRTLTIEGTGAINDYSGWDSTQDNDSRAFNPFNAEWYPYGIKRVVIGEGITEIPGSAFYMEVGLKSVNLPSTLTAIGMDAFGECENIETITCNATTPPTLADDGNEDYVFYVPNEDWSAVLPIPTVSAIKVPTASVNAYKAADGWSSYADKIQMPNTTVGETHWATFYDASKSYEVDANTTVYKASLSGTTLTLTEIGGNQIITAGNAVILKSTSAPVLTETTTESTANFDENSLKGSADPVAPNASYKRYVLAYQNSTLGFYKLGDAVTIPAGKAYLEVSGAAAPWFIDFSEEEGTPTKIEEPQSEVSEEDVIYTLQGQRVSQPLTSGVYIVNGKKVFIRK